MLSKVVNPSGNIWSMRLWKYLQMKNILSYLFTTSIKVYHVPFRRGCKRVVMMTTKEIFLSPKKFTLSNGKQKTDVQLENFIV